MSNNMEDDHLSIINLFVDNKLQTFELWDELLNYGFVDSNEEFISKYKNFDAPWHITNYMIELSKIDLNTTILEPAFNHGVFLLALLEHMKFNYKMSPKELLSWFNNKVTGYEENPLKFEMVKGLIILFFFKHGLDIKPSQLYNLFNDNFIDNKRQTFFYDIAIGSLPYSQLKELSDEEVKKIKKVFPSTRVLGEVTGAYFEQTWNFAQRFCFLSSNSFLQDDFNDLSTLLLPKITHLVNFEKIISPKIFRGVSISHGFTHLKNEQCFYSKDIYQSFRVEDKAMISSQFDLNNVSLNSTIFQPFSYHEIFHVTQLEDKFITKDGTEVEKEICIPFVDFSLNNYENFKEITNFVIYPYSNFSLISEVKMEKIYPKTYSYFLKNENCLLERDIGKAYDYENFYAYPNQFGVSHFLPETILIIPFYINQDVKPYKLLAKDITESEYFFFKGAYIIDGSDEYVNKFFEGNHFYDFLKKNSTPISLNATDTFKVQFNLIQQFLGKI